MSNLRPFAIVKVISPEKIRAYGLGVDSLYGEKSVIYLGEIPQMPGHGVFAGRSGKVYYGYHISDWREATEEEV